MVINKLGVHRRVTELVYGSSTENWKHDDRLKFLGLTGLDKRKIRSDLLETFTILNGFYNINRSLFLSYMMVAVEAMKRNNLKEDFVSMLENLFLLTG